MDSVNVGDTVRIDKCDSYPKLVGSNAEVRAVLSDNRVALKYGRGRPPAGRPDVVDLDDVSVVSGDN